MVNIVNLPKSTGRMTMEELILEYLGQLTDEQKAYVPSSLMLIGNTPNVGVMYSVMSDFNSIEMLGLLNAVSHLIFIEGMEE